MFVACSTLCFSREPLEAALRHIAELEFNKIDVAIVEDSPHLRPSEVAENPEAALHRIRYGPSLTPAALDLDFGAVDSRLYRRRFEVMCRLAKPLMVAVLTIPAAPAGTAFDVNGSCRLLVLSFAKPPRDAWRPSGGRQCPFRACVAASWRARQTARGAGKRRGRR